MAHRVDLKQYIDELTTCPICLEDLVIPKSLPCVHTFCLQCIRDHCRGSLPGASINCPVCRSSFVIPSGGVEELPNDFVLNGLVAAKKASGRSDDFVPCIGCSDPSEATASSRPTTPATGHCINCGQNICDSCSKPHGKIPGHDIIPLSSELQSEAILSQKSFCSQHPLNQLEMYCIQCKMNLCVTCLSIEHQKHTFQSINEAYVGFRDTLKRDIQRVSAREKIIQQDFATLQIEQERGIDNVLRKETDLTQFAGEIRNRVDDAMHRMTLQLSVEKKEVSKLALDKKRQFQVELSSYQRFTSYASELVKNGKPCDVTHEYVELHPRAGELLQRVMPTHDNPLPAHTASSEDLFDDLFDFISSKSTKYRMQEQNAACEMNKMQQERDTVNNQLTKLTAECSANAIYVKHLEKKIEDLEHEKNDLTTLKLLVEQLQKEKEDTRRQTEDMEDKAKTLEKEKDDIVKERVGRSARPRSRSPRPNYASPLHNPQTQKTTHFQHSNARCSTDDRSSYLKERPISRCILTTGDPVVALTSLRDELFVLRHESRQEIRTYDASNFTFKRSLRISGLSNDTRWCGMTSCAANKCIYVSDSKQNVVYRVHSNTKKISTWTVDRRPNGLSSTYTGNIVIAYYKACKLQEYSQNGSLVREICLRGHVKYPTHAILLNTGNFVVSHHGPDYGISVVDTLGRVLDQSHNHFGYQRYMAVDKDRFVMVADSKFNRIRIVDLFKHTVNDMCLPIGGGLIEPWSLCYDNLRSRLYVGECEGKRVHVFDFVGQH